MSILHLTNTNINYDSRILKEIACLSDKYGKFEIFGFGVSLEEDSSRDQVVDDPRFHIISLVLNRFRVFPRGIRYFFALIEFTVRSVVFGLKLRPSVVHCHDTFALPAGAFLSFFGVKLVYDAHELESDKKAQTGILSKVTLWIERICWSRISGFITVSDSILEWYRERFSEVPSEVVLNSPVSKTLANPASELSLREKFNIPENQLIFVYVGILSVGRGIDDILDAFAVLQDSHVVFLGYGPMQNTIESCSIEYQNIHYHPAVSHERVTQVVASADYGFCLIENCSLSDYLCLPNKLFEYAFSGVKVIASNFPEIKMVVEKYGIGVVVDDSEDLVDVISSIEKSTCAVEVENLEPLSWVNQKRKLISLYTKIFPINI